MDTPGSRVYSKIFAFLEGMHPLFNLFLKMSGIVSNMFETISGQIGLMARIFI